MNAVVVALLAGLGLWMLACAWCGFKRRFIGFLTVLVTGLTLNMIWLAYGLGVKPFEGHAMMAQVAALLFALCGFGAGWMAGRLNRQFRSSQVTDNTGV